MAKSKRIVYLTSEQYAELVTNETLTVDGVTIAYSDTDIYITPQDEPVTDVQVNGTSVVTNGVANVQMASEETATALLSELTKSDDITDIFLTVLAWYIDNLPQNESAQDIANALKLEADRLEQIYDFWIAEKEGA